MLARCLKRASNCLFRAASRLHFLHYLVNAETCRFLAWWELLESREELTHKCLRGNQKVNAVNEKTVKCNNSKIRCVDFMKLSCFLYFISLRITKGTSKLISYSTKTWLNIPSETTRTDSKISWQGKFRYKIKGERRVNKSSVVLVG